ncbi:hypothetical protein Bbelb_327900 [Branchiostoma belcheri]|nr:hypothetical protein Bbelb_327900 [Branchiostoma belcheri]
MLQQAGFYSLTGSALSPALNTRITLINRQTCFTGQTVGTKSCSQRRVSRELCTRSEISSFPGENGKFSPARFPETWDDVSTAHVPSGPTCTGKALYTIFLTSLRGLPTCLAPPQGAPYPPGPTPGAPYPPGPTPGKPHTTHGSRTSAQRTAHSPPRRPLVPHPRDPLPPPQGTSLPPPQGMSLSARPHPRLPLCPNPRGPPCPPFPTPGDPLPARPHPYGTRPSRPGVCTAGVTQIPSDRRTAWEGTRPVGPAFVRSDADPVRQTSRPPSPGATGDVRAAASGPLLPASDPLKFDTARQAGIAADSAGLKQGYRWLVQKCGLQQGQLRIERPEAECREVV